MEAGAGYSLYGAQSLAIYDFNAIKIGLLAFSDNEPDWEAKEKMPGVFYVPIDLEDNQSFIFMVEIDKKKIVRLMRRI